MVYSKHSFNIIKYFKLTGQHTSDLDLPLAPRRDDSSLIAIPSLPDVGFTERYLKSKESPLHFCQKARAQQKTKQILQEYLQNKLYFTKVPETLLRVFFLSAYMK